MNLHYVMHRIEFKGLNSEQIYIKEFLNYLVGIVVVNHRTIL